MAAAITHNYMLVCNIGLLSAVTIIARLLQNVSVMMVNIQYLINHKASNAQHTSHKCCDVRQFHLLFFSRQMFFIKLHVILIHGFVIICIKVIYD